MSVATSVLTLLWLAADTGASAVAVEPAATTVSLDVRASPDCTSRADLLARIARRSPRIRAVEGGARVEIHATFGATASGSVLAELQLAEAGEVPSSRRLVGRSCAEAANGVALIIAVTLDPTAALEGAGPAREPPSRATERASSVPESAATTPAPSKLPSEARQPIAESPARATPEPPRAAELVVSRPAPPPTAPPSASSRYGVGLAGQTLSGPAPAVMPGVAVYALAALDRPSPWSPALVVGVLHVWRAGLDEPGGSASFTADALGLDLCGIRLHGWVVEGRGCASALVGRLSARGSQTYAAASAIRWLATAGLSTVLAAQLGGHVEVFGRLGMGAALVRDSFEFAPNVFHRTGALAVSASLGLGVRLP